METEKQQEEEKWRRLVESHTVAYGQQINDLKMELDKMKAEARGGEARGGGDGRKWDDGLVRAKDMVPKEWDGGLAGRKSFKEDIERYVLMQRRKI